MILSEKQDNPKDISCNEKEAVKINNLHHFQLEGKIRQGEQKRRKTLN